MHRTPAALAGVGFAVLAVIAVAPASFYVGGLVGLYVGLSFGLALWWRPPARRELEREHLVDAGDAIASGPYLH